jgi:hypothetical protein
LGSALNVHPIRTRPTPLTIQAYAGRYDDCAIL